MLLGQTLEGMQVWDVRRAVQAVRTLEGLQDAPLEIEAAGEGAGLAVYAALFEPGIDRLELAKVPATHREGPILLNVNRFLGHAPGGGHGRRADKGPHDGLERGDDVCGRGGGEAEVVDGGRRPAGPAAGTSYRSS